MTRMPSSYYSYLLVILLISLSEARLRLVNVIFRHGDRTPSAGDEMFPNDPYNREEFYPIGRGGLTNQGKQREYKLGQVLRERYDDFLDKIYSPNILRARSTDYERTKMSLQLVLASLFPPQEMQKWNDEMNWQPIPYNYVPRLNDSLLIPEECPQYLMEMRRMLQSPDMKDKMSGYTEFMQNLTQLTGKNIHNAYDMYNLYLGLDAELHMNLTLPNWTNDISFPKGQLLDGTYLYYNTFSETTKLKRLNGGMLVREFLENMDKARNGSSRSPKMYLYSGHETNIAAALQALKVYYPHVPQFSSAVIVELAEVKGQYFVQVLYYKGIPAKLVPLKLPECTQMCPLEKFVEILSDVVPSDEERQCNKGDGSFNLDRVYERFGNYIYDVNKVIHVR